MIERGPVEAGAALRCARGMGDTPNTVTTQLQATLWEQVGAATRANVGELAEVLDQLASAPVTDPLLAERGVRLAHMVAGSAGVYGFRDEAHAASRIEAVLRTIDGPDVELGEATVELARLRSGFRVAR
jgi:chemotaxis protein histidine kinase CheA